MKWIWIYLSVFLLKLLEAEAQNFTLSCVSTSAINAAFHKAQRQTGLEDIGSEPTDYELDLLGRTLETATSILAKKCSLTSTDIFIELPAIDTSDTDINGFCPSLLQPVLCNVTRYRTLNGYCNNLNHPVWGAAKAPYRRLIPPAYADAVAAPRKSVTGAELPSARDISIRVHKNMGFTEQDLTLHFVSWGQLIDHDMVDTVKSTESSGEELHCCPRNDSNPACFPIVISSSDPFYSQHEVSCLNLARSAASPKVGCRLGVRDQFNKLTSYLDASFVYGVNDETSESLRAFTGGLLRTQSVFAKEGLKDLSPLRTDEPDDDCFRTNTSTFCFLTGDTRSSQQPMLSTPHTIFMREHNRIAAALQQINPFWDDEKIFQEARHIVAALVQKITYDEYLPLLLGKGKMKQYGLELLPSGFYNGYSSMIDASLSDAFNAAAFRFGHSTVPSTIQRWNSKHQYIGSQRFRDIFYQPWDLYKPGYVDQYLLGMMNQIAQKTDDAVTEDLTNHLEQEPTDNHGSDLAAINIQRGRDHGIPSYNQFRVYCGLPPARRWSDLFGIMNNQIIAAFSQIYISPEDLDLWSAGISEFPVRGSTVGPTFNCIIAQTFKNLRNGDRFWFENGGWPSSFTLEQLDEIRKVKYARILCDNSDNIETVQLNVMQLADPFTNPRVSCRSSVLPSMDLTKWKQ